MPAARFSSCVLSEHNSILGCHHGRLLVFNFSGNQVYLVVWDPITDDRHHIDIPEIFKGNKIYVQKGVVVCASREKDHIHGACHSEPFHVVLIGLNMEGVLACVYSSKTCTWGNLISLSQPQLPNITFGIYVPTDCQSSLVGNSLYFENVPGGMTDAILEFDLHKQTLSIIDAPPPDASNINASMFHDDQSFILPADGGGISFIVLSDLTVHVWKRISNGHGVAGWLFEKTVNLSNLLSLKPRVDWINIQGPLRIVGHDEDNNIILRLRDSGILYFVDLKTLQFKELPGKIGLNIAHPFSSFYTAGMNPKIGMHGEENVNNAENGLAG